MSGMALVVSRQDSGARAVALGPHRTIVFSATVEAMSRASEDVRSFLASCAVDAAATHAVDVAFEELVGNVVRYAYDERHRGRIDVELLVLPERLRLTVTDDGKPFDPTHFPVADRPRSIAEAKLGGRGISMVRKVVADWSYRRNARRNWNVVEIARASA